MRKHKYKATVTEYGKEIDIILAFDNLDDLYSAIGRHGDQIRNNMRSYVMDDKHGNEMYEGDRVKRTRHNKFWDNPVVIDYDVITYKAPSFCVFGMPIGNYVDQEVELEVCDEQR